MDPAGIRIAVIGAGLAGRSFALMCAKAGFPVVLEDVMPAKLRHAEADFRSLGLGVELVSTVEAAVQDAEVVLDFVPDELESKLEIFSLIDRMAPPRTVMCTPSEVLSITDLASCTYRADRCVMVRGALSASNKIQVLSARSTSKISQELITGLFEQLGFEVKALADPDLPMLLKNMNTTAL